MSVNVQTVSPVNQNAPRNFINTNPLGSDFAAAYSLTTSYGINIALDPNIIQTIPESFGAFKWYLATSKKAVPSKEWNWLQASYPNRSLVASANVAAVVAVPGASVTQTISIADLSIPVLAIGIKVVYPNNQTGVTTAVVRTPGAGSVTVRSMIGEGLPAVTSGQQLANHGSVGGDDQYGFDNFYTSDYVRYSNIMEMFYDAERWGEAQLIQLQNTQQVNFIQQQKQDLNFRAMARNEATFWLGQYGMNVIPPNQFFAGSGYQATYTRGVLQHLTADGVTTTTVTPGSAMDNIRQVIYDLSDMAKTKNWMLYGTSESLGKVGMAERSERIRYSPTDTVVNTEVTGYKLFNDVMVTPISNDAWKDTTYYGDILRDDLILAPMTGDQNGAGISICHMENYPLLRNRTFDRINDGMAKFSINAIDGMWGTEVRKAYCFKRFRMNG